MSDGGDFEAGSKLPQAKREQAPALQSSSLISVILPVHDGIAPVHFRAALESLRSQTHTQFECIVVADGSIHEALIEQIDAQDQRFRLITLCQQGGPARARNAGIREAAGDYIALLDADDVALPDRLARQAAALREGKADIVGSWYYLIDESGGRTGEKRMPVTGDAIRRSLAWRNPIANSTVMAKAEVLKAHLFDEAHGQRLGRVYGEDYELWIRLARAGCPMENLSEFLVEHRVDNAFIKRRQGWAPFLSDFQNKRRALALRSRVLRPALWVVALVSSALRLLPPPALAVVYRLTATSYSSATSTSGRL
ncbi:MAG: glycosyltransferase [Candidatus Hydrogenedentes bacterium]|nr:glycosyltransferase [Candidatus Hydrogenedentota bacterium]